MRNKIKMKFPKQDAFKSVYAGCVNLTDTGNSRDCVRNIRKSIFFQLLTVEIDGERARKLL